MKKIISCFLSVILLIGTFSLFVNATELADMKIDTPDSFFYTATVNDKDDIISLYYVVPQNINALTVYAANNPDYLKEKYGYDDVKVYIQSDWKIDSGDWHFTEDWDTYSTEGAGFEVDAKIANYEEVFKTYQPYACECLGITYGESNHFAFTKHSLQMKCRYCVELYKDSSTLPEKIIHSSWSEPQTVSPSNTVKTPTNFEAVKVENVQVKYDEKNDNRPYISFTIPFTNELKTMAVAALAADNRELLITVQRKIGDDIWETCEDLHSSDTPYSYGERRIYIPTSYIKSSDEISYRIFFMYYASDNSVIDSFITNYSENLTYKYTPSEEPTTSIDEPEPIEKNDNTVLILASIGAAIVLVAVVVIFVVKKKKEEEK